MKKLTYSILTLLCLKAEASDISSIKIVTPVEYKFYSSGSKVASSKFQTALAGLFDIDIKAKVVEKLKPHEQDLTKYYSSSNDYNSFVNKVIDQGIKTHLSKVNDENLIKFYGHLGNNLIGEFANKILEKEGVKSAKNRKAWIKKITDPFNQCIAKATNSQFDGNHCIEALTASLIPSIGIAITYELSVQNLDNSIAQNEKSSFHNARVNQYKNCIPNTNIKSSHVKGCTLNSIKSGVSQVTDKTLTSKINSTASSKESANKIKLQVWPKFDDCLKSITPSTPDAPKSFNNCIDLLVVNTGSLVVEDQISHKDAVKSTFGKNGAEDLGKKKSLSFKTCAENQIKQNKRSGGMVDIAPCENSVTNEVTYLVVAETLKKAADDALKSTPDKAKNISKESISILNSCWNNNQTPDKREACLKKSIIGLSQGIANIKLDTSIPSDVKDKNQLKSSAVNNLTNCLNKELPKNISESKDLMGRINNCSEKVTTDTAVSVAESKVRETAKENLTPSEVNLLVKKHVNGEFEKCIGKNPNEKKLNDCANNLTSNAAIEITSKSFDSEVNDYINKAGGLKALGLTQQDVNNFLKKLTDENTRCISKKTQNDPMEKVNVCVKNSIKDIALFFGQAQFDKNVGDMYKDRMNDQKKLESNLKSELSKCLEQKSHSKFTIEDYTKNLYVCSEKISKSVTRQVAQDQIDFSLNTYLADKAAINNNGLRSSIKNTLLSQFDDCMNKTESSTCIDNLKKEATSAIVFNYGKQEASIQLSTHETPSEVRKVEEEFFKCTNTTKKGEDLAKHLDECTKNYALSFAKELGELKLKFLLKQALGSDEFNKNKSKIDETVAYYNKCLDDLKRFSMSDNLTSKLTTCTDNLTKQGMNIVSRNLSSWMNENEKDSITRKVKDEFATLLPCLSGLLPATPYSKELSENVDSSLKVVSTYLAQYIEYDPENASKTLDHVLKNLKVDLNSSADSEQAKKDIIQLIYEQGGLDQFLKAIVRGTVIDGLKNVSEQDVPSDIRALITDKKNFDEIFSTSKGQMIKEELLNNILNPILVSGKGMNSPEIKDAMDGITGNVIELLVRSPQFGHTIARSGIQAKLDELKGVTRFFAKAFYGKDSLVWENVRNTPEGQKAEELILEKILKPKFKGEIVSDADMKAVESVVTKSVKNYKKSK